MRTTPHAPQAHLASPSLSPLIGGLRGAVSIFLVAGAGLFPSALFAAPLLRCEIKQADSVRVLDFKPVSDPYKVAAIDIEGRFRFKAVVIGDARQVEYIKLYVYDQVKRQPVLLHQVSYLAPVATSGAVPSALTGVHYVYSPQLERELQYSCALLENAP